MNIQEILNFRPQLVDVKYGPEACLHEVLIEYYARFGIKKEVAKQYIQALEKQFNNSMSQPRGYAGSSITGNDDTIVEVHFHTKQDAASFRNKIKQS